MSDRAARVDLRTAFAWGFGITVLTRLVFIPLGYVAQWLMADTDGGLAKGWLDVWSYWDATHLLTIAEVGYFAPTSDANAEAFFPLYPLLVRPFLLIGLPKVVAGMLVSALASAVALAFLYRLAEEEYGENAGRHAAFYLALFPTSVFLIAPYTESLFLAGAIAAFYYARRQQWNLVIVPAAIATGTRAAGVFLILGLAVEALRQRDFSVKRIGEVARTLILALVPAAAYLLYLARQPAGLGTFFEAQETGWNRNFQSPIKSLTATIDLVIPGLGTSWVAAYRLELVGAALGLGFIVWALFKKEWGYAAFMGATLAVLISDTFYFSVPRIVLTFFPAMLFLAAWTRDKPAAHSVALATLAPFAAMGVIVFNSSKWFF